MYNFCFCKYFNKVDVSVIDSYVIDKAYTSDDWDFIDLRSVYQLFYRML